MYWTRIPQPCDAGGGHYYDGTFDISDSVHFVADEDDIQKIIKDVRRYARRVIGGVDYIQMYEGENNERIILMDKTSREDLDDLKNNPTYTKDDIDKYHRVKMFLESEVFLNR